MVMSSTIAFNSINALVVKRDTEFDIRNPKEWYNNKIFLISAGATCVGLFVIFAPLVACIIYSRRRSKSSENDEKINTIFKGNGTGSTVSLARNPRVSSMLISDKRISGASSLPYSAYGPPSQFLSASTVPGDHPTYSNIIRDSFINDSLNDSEKLSQGFIPAPFNRIALNHLYLIVRGYIATEFDEMTVNEGNRIAVFKVYEDGWVLCMNQENKNQGVIPSDCFNF